MKSLLTKAEKSRVLQIAQCLRTNKLINKRELEHKLTLKFNRIHSPTWKLPFQYLKDNSAIQFMGKTPNNAKWKLVKPIEDIEAMLSSTRNIIEEERETPKTTISSQPHLTKKINKIDNCIRTVIETGDIKITIEKTYK